MRSLNGTVRDRRGDFADFGPDLQGDSGGPPPLPPASEPTGGLTGGPAGVGGEFNPVVTINGGPQTLDPNDPNYPAPPTKPRGGGNVVDSNDAAPPDPVSEVNGLADTAPPPPPLPNVEIPGTFSSPANPAQLTPFRTSSFMTNRTTGTAFGPGDSALTGAGGGGSYEEMLRKLRGGR